MSDITDPRRALSPSAPSGARAGAGRDPGGDTGRGGPPGVHGAGPIGSGRRIMRRGSIGGAPRFTLRFLKPSTGAGGGGDGATGRGSGRATLFGFRACTEDGFLTFCLGPAV